MTKYIIVNHNNRYVGIDKLSKFTLVSDIRKATFYDEREKAVNVMINNLDNSKNTYRIEEYDNGKDEVPVNARMIDVLEQTADINDEPYIDQSLPYDLKEFCTNLINSETELSNEKKRLEALLHKICKAITDINHKLELTPKMSASYRCKLSILESDLYRKRREVKNDLYYIDCVNDF